jgi:hypothetical protein
MRPLLVMLMAGLLPLAAQTAAPPQAAPPPAPPPAPKPAAEAPKPDAAQTKPDAAQTNPAGAQAKPDPAAAKPDAATAKPDAAAAKPDAAAPKPAVASAKPDAASPVPTAESWLTGSIDVGYRWQTGVGGSLDTYRSIVNLGSGPKLLGADFTLVDPKHRAFDRMNVRASSWGDDPYSTFHLDAKKSKLYDFNIDYRNIAYFNFLPSFADPLLARGITLNEQSFDTRRRFASLQLDLLPGNWFVPYFAYERDSGSGRGATAFVSDADEYAVPNTLRDRTNLYRGGVRFELKRFHATFEEGGTTFNDDQSVFTATNAANFGNRSTQFLNQTLSLSNLLASYGIRGGSFYSKILFTANATPWLDLYGQFLFSQPDSTVDYRQTDTGNLVVQNQLLFYTSQQYLVSAAAKLPHTSSSFGAEIRPMGRVRIVESWLTDRVRDSGSASSSQTLTTSLGPASPTSASLASSLATNYNQQEVNLFFDATSRLTLRVGYRYVWGDASYSVLPPGGLISADRGKLRRNVGLAGLVFRPTAKISVSGEVELGSSGGEYFRTSLHDYQKIRARARYQATASLSLSADFSLLNNQNPLTGIHYDYLAHQASLAFLWAPGAGRTWDFQGSYSRSTLRSDISYFSPQDLLPQRSFYRDDAHTVTALFSANLPKHYGITPKISAGGSFFLSAGSRPSRDYQPLVKALVPLSKNLNWFTEWRYCGYGEAFYLYEGFRTHLITTGLRLTR